MEAPTGLSVPVGGINIGILSAIVLIYSIPESDLDYLNPLQNLNSDF
jgi:hypothetical protein